MCPGCRASSHGAARNPPCASSRAAARCASTSAGMANVASRGAAGHRTASGRTSPARRDDRAGLAGPGRPGSGAAAHPVGRGRRCLASLGDDPDRDGHDAAEEGGRAPSSASAGRAAAGGAGLVLSACCRTAIGRCGSTIRKPGRGPTGSSSVGAALRCSSSSGRRPGRAGRGVAAGGLRARLRRAGPAAQSAGGFAARRAPGVRPDGSALRARTRIRASTRPSPGDSEPTSIVAVIALAMSFVFSSSLTSLADHPRDYGWKWTTLVQAQGGWGLWAPDDIAAALAHQPGVTGWSQFGFGQLTIDHSEVPVMGVQQAAPARCSHPPPAATP